MICNSRRTIFYIYNTAFCKTVLFHQLLHNPIIGMGIHSDIPGNIFTVIRNTLKQSMHLSIPGKPVDCKIWFIIQPVAVFNMFICRICTFKQCTYPMYPIFVVYYLAGILMNVRPNQFFIRIKMSPLCRISGCII